MRYKKYCNRIASKVDPDHTVLGSCLKNQLNGSTLFSKQNLLGLTIVRFNGVLKEGSLKILFYNKIVMIRESSSFQ